MPVFLPGRPDRPPPLVCTFTGNRPAYLLGAVVHMLCSDDLRPHDRDIYENRDILAAGMTLEPDTRQLRGAG